MLGANGRCGELKVKSKGVNTNLKEGKMDRGVVYGKVVCDKGKGMWGGIR